MRKFLSAAVWIFGLAIPLTALAIVASAYMTNYPNHIVNMVDQLLSVPTGIGRPLILEVSERLPEVAGMVVGMLIILLTLIASRTPKNVEAQDKGKPSR